MLAGHGFIQQVTVETSRVFNDLSGSPHYYFFNLETKELGELKDIDAEQFEMLRMSEPLPSKRVTGVDVMVRLKSTG